MVVQIQPNNQTTKIKYKYLINLTRKKRKKEITTNIHYNISKYSSINERQADQLFRYAFCECLKQYIV